VVLVASTGCSSLPRSGPSANEIVDRFKEAPNPLGIQLVDLSPIVVDTLDKAPQPSFQAIDQLGVRHPVDQIGPGDVLAISVYEAGPGLFSNAQRQTPAGDTGTSAETLPRIQVDRNGRIEFPFVGSISVAGHTTTEVQDIIKVRLAEKAAQPQVIVSVVSGDTNSVIVSGDVRSPGRRPLTLSHENLLDVIALSGGPSHDAADSVVTVARGRASATVPLPAVQAISTENIAMAPQDRVQVDFAPRSFLVFGATGRVAQTPFEARRVSLAEAMARSGGLDDNRADPASVFLFREEPAATARALGFQTTQSTVPIIYRADLRDPQNFFLMERLSMRDKDLLYAANAKTVQIYKFLQLIYTIVTPVVTGKQLSN
jgi:polysaccharide export outer membrane protein